jgi:hypothetical protein
MADPQVMDCCDWNLTPHQTSAETKGDTRFKDKLACKYSLNKKPLPGHYS